jgi:ABC-type nickel/cobalt efflux system permease component RcnA
MKIINKIITLLTAVIMILILVGLVFSSSVRNNLTDLSENLYNSGSVGILVAIWLIWSFSTTPKTLKKLLKAKGFNSKFWQDL